MITQEYLKSILHYDPKTGIFTRKKTKEQAGYVCHSERHGYRMIRVGMRKQLSAHRIAFLYMTGSIPERVDHKNRIKTDNRWSNLRACTHSQNIANTKVSIHNRLGLKGVRKHGNKFQARLCKNGKAYYLGTFDTPEEAHAAYCAKGQELFGSFFCAG